ncbi:MAG: DEAD/DEAH box helicase [Bacillota bacterium]
MVVATGTGSGKTEAFLLPILFHLYREFMAGSLCPGVRALILYPMNALSNDQRDRLGAIAKRLHDYGSPFQFTFGQYIGETPDNIRDTRRNGPGYDRARLPGELVFRDEMRSTPPHIFLTNYSMLEYLLIRPGDSPLFDDGHSRWWTFLVLDEAHQYRGTRGMEMAMLIRRLKQRLRQGGRESPIQCVATSATLLGGEADRLGVARFASALFDAPFSEEDVIVGERESVPDDGHYTLSSDDYQVVRAAVESPEDSVFAQLRALAERCGLKLPVGIPAVQAAGHILLSDKRATRLRRLLSEGPAHVRIIADQVFPELPASKRPTSLSQLVQLLAAVPDPSTCNTGTPLPLLSPRYHLYLRSLEGAFIRYLPQREVTLNRHQQDEAACFELALCRECGQHYLVGKLAGGSRTGQFTEAIRDPGHSDFGVDFLLPLEDQTDLVEDDDGTDKAGEQVADQGGTYYLCLRCRAYWREGFPPACEHGSNEGSLLRVIRQRAREGQDSLPQCGACGYRGPDPVKEVIHGADGPNAVIATTLFQQLPSDRRKVLAFADGRQEAAFFAWYLGRTYEDIFFRNVILRASQRLMPYSPEGLSLRDLAEELAAIIHEEGLAGPMATPVELRRMAWRAVLREFLTNERRISLEGTGSGRWEIRWPPWFRIPEVLLAEPWLLSEDEARHLLFLLLDTLREARAVHLPWDTGVSISWEEVNPYPAKRARLGDRRGEAFVESWDSPSCKRTKLLAKILELRGFPTEQAQRWAVQTLREVWDAFAEFERAIPDRRQALFLPVQNARQLNPGWWRFKVLGPGEQLYVCSWCGKLHFASVGGICARPACRGRLYKTSVDELPHNHYRDMYRTDLPGLLRVEEHTAQLGREKAREFQQAFKDGHIGVLSSSTTFELGVDLGDLDTVFLRNIPPEAFNYAQRVGRAGRRPGHCGFAVSYCRRSPHDLYHFARPERMLKGLTSPPVLRLSNQKILLRHVTAVVLGRFFRANPGRFGLVRDFFVDLAAPQAVADVKQFARQHRHELESLLRSVVPSDMWSAIGLKNGEWIELVAGTLGEGQDSRLVDAEKEVASDYRRVRKIEEESSRGRQHERAKWARNRAQDLENEDILSFLSRKAVIPKYGFPVDVVELDTQRKADEIELQRDRAIAISEYAPTAQVVANKKVWESCGIKIVPDRPPRVRYYRKCTVHNRFDSWDETQDAPPGAPCCDQMSSRRKYVIPWFGFVTKPDEPKEPQRRPEKLFTSRPFFIGLAGPDRGHVDVPAGQPLIRLTKACPGKMAVICEGHRGQGFYICLRCGAGFRKREKSHRTPQGTQCSGVLESVALGHEFITDIVRLDFLHRPSFPVLDPMWFAYSLAYALAGAASDTLEVPSTDLNATVGYPEGEGLPPIILYDNAPGGAALVARLEEEDTLRACLEAARARVDGACGCGEDDSCYGCLRNYSNQFAHTRLRRGPVHRFLTELIDLWPATTPRAISTPPL